jgi:MFS family permease
MSNLNDPMEKAASLHLVNTRISEIQQKIDCGDEDDEREKKKRCAIVTVLCLINLLANSAYSSIAPFFPKEAQAHGLPISSIGFIFSGYSVSMCIFAPMFNHMMNSLGRKWVLILGCLCEAIAMICFGFFVLIESPVAYGILSCLCRFVEGFGNGCLNSATNSII